MEENEKTFRWQMNTNGPELYDQCVKRNLPHTLKTTVLPCQPGMIS